MITYRPLPEGLRIQKSGIDGEGLFSLTFIKEYTNLGMTHIVLNHDPKENDDEIVRTPLGGFINHSDDPNCVKEKKGNRYYLKTLRDINRGDELTVKYSFYKVRTESEKMQEELEPICPMSDE